MRATIRGIAYPLQIEDGTLKVNVDDDLVRDAVLSVLNVKRGEYLTRPRYGTPEFIFDLPSSKVVEEVKTALNTQVVADYPTVVFQVDGAPNSDGRIDLEIRYTVAGIQQPALTLLF